jgi:antitoxin VapB
LVHATVIRGGAIKARLANGRATFNSDFLQKPGWIGILIINTSTRVATMSLQIANPVVVAKIEQLARATGLTKAAVVERAIDNLARQTQAAAMPGRMAALLAQLDRVPDRVDAFDPLQA